MQAATGAPCARRSGSQIAASGSRDLSAGGGAAVAKVRVRSAGGAPVHVSGVKAAAADGNPVAVGQPTSGGSGSWWVADAPGAFRAEVALSPTKELRLKVLCNPRTGVTFRGRGWSQSSPPDPRACGASPAPPEPRTGALLEVRRLTQTASQRAARRAKTWWTGPGPPEGVLVLAGRTATSGST